MKRLAAASATSIAIFAYMQWQGSSEYADTFLLAATGSAALASSIMMIALTRIWSFRAVGLMMMLAGLAIYSLAAVGVRLDHIHDEGTAIALNAVRSLWGVGVPCFAYGLVMMVVTWVTGSRESDPAHMLDDRDGRKDA